MSPLNRKITMALGVALTLSMTQSSDAQLFRFRRAACPQPTVSQCCAQQQTAAVAPEITYQAPQPAVELATIVESATIPAPAVEQSFTPVTVQTEAIVQAQPLAVDYPIIESNVVPTVFESTPVADNSEVVIYDSASDIEVTAPASSVLAPTAASEEVVLAGPTPEAAPTPVAVPEEDVTAPAPTNVLVPEPVATGETIIKEAMDQPAPDQPVVTPMLKEAADAAKAAAVETVEKSVLK